MRASYDFTRFFLFVHNVPANARDIGESFWNLKVSSIQLEEDEEEEEEEEKPGPRKSLWKRG